MDTPQQEWISKALFRVKEPSNEWLRVVQYHVYGILE